MVGLITLIQEYVYHSNAWLPVALLRQLYQTASRLDVMAILHKYQP